MALTYIPSRIDSVLKNLNDQAELWQKEAQHRQRMGVELYELGLKSNRSDLMEQGVNMIERRDTLGRPFAKRFQFNYEKSGLDRGELKDVPVNDVQAQMDGRFKPKTAQEAYAYMKSINDKKMMGDKTGTQMMSGDAMGYINQLSKGVDFSEMRKNPKEWDTFISTIANLTDDASMSKMSEEDKIMMDAVMRRNAEAEQRRMSPDSQGTMAPDRMSSRYPHVERSQDALTKAYEAYSHVPLGAPYTPIDRSQSHVDRSQKAPGIENKSQAELDRMVNWENNRKEAERFSPESYKNAAKKEFVATKRSFAQLQKHRDAVKADAKRFVNETKAYNSRKEKVEQYNKEVMDRRAEIDEIDRMITSKDGQVRAEGYRRLHEYEVAKAGNSERAIVAADKRYQSNMTGLMLHYNDPIDPRVFGTKRDFGRSGPAAKFDSYSAMVPVNGKMIRGAFNIPVGTPDVKDWIINHYKAKGIKVSYDDIEDIVKTGETGYKGEAESKILNDFDGNVTPEAVAQIQQEIDKEVDGLAVFNTTEADAEGYVIDNRKRFAEKGIALRQDGDRVIAYVPKARDGKGFYTIINGKYKKYDGSNVKFIASEQDINNYLALFGVGSENIAKAQEEETEQNNEGVLKFDDLKNFKPKYANDLIKVIKYK